MSIKIISIIFTILLFMITPVFGMVNIVYLDEVEFQKSWDFYPTSTDWGQMPTGRMFAADGKVFINNDAFWISQQDYTLTLQHEINHVNGIKHTIFGIMSPLPFLRGELIYTLLILILSIVLIYIMCNIILRKKHVNHK